MKVVEMWLPQEIAPRGQKYRHLHQQLQQIWKPRLQRPERSQASRETNFGQKTRNEAKRRESVRLKVIPRLEQGVGARYRREVHLKPMVERSGEEIHRHWPQTKELLRASGRTFNLPGMNCGSRRMELASQRQRIAWATELRVVERILPSFRR